MVIIHIPPELKRFLESDYAQKILLTAQFNGQEMFKYGKKSYDIKQLLKEIDFMKSNK